MKVKDAAAILLMLLSSSVFAWSGAPVTVSYPAPMWNADVIALVKANVEPEKILYSVAHCQPHFLLTPRYTKVLFDAGVSEYLFRAMAAAQAGREFPAKPLPEPSKRAWWKW